MIPAVRYKTDGGLGVELIGYLSSVPYLKPGIYSWSYSVLERCDFSLDPPELGYPKVVHAEWWVKNEVVLILPPTSMVALVKGFIPIAGVDP